MACCAFGWLIFARSGASIAFFGGRIDPAQNLLEVVLDCLVAKAGPDPQRVGVADQYRAAAGLHHALPPEFLHHPAAVSPPAPHHRPPLPILPPPHALPPP